MKFHLNIAIRAGGGSLQARVKVIISNNRFTKCCPILTIATKRSNTIASDTSPEILKRAVKHYHI